MIRIGAMVSGGGTNLQAILDAADKGQIDGKVVTVVSSKEGAYALERAAKHGISSTVITKKEDPSTFDDRLIAHFKENNVDLIVLAGYMTILGEKFIKAFENKIMNIHPALIPSFCGDGYYGLRVHQAALEKGVKVSGATVHFVSPITDGGPIILQKAVAVEDDDTPETLQKRIMQEAEWKIFPEAIQLFALGKLKVEGNKVRRLK
ncbi:MAG TPA: phosphoribosylglycinamide formyltransferase [Lachnospiraceae bacterium]|nr:phosphoribosylglycinamide formyltransferase [Lachnospiraceae bacterium]